MSTALASIGLTSTLGIANLLQYLHNFNFTANITFQAYTLYIPILFQPPLHVLRAHVFQPPSDADITIKPFLIWNGQIFLTLFKFYTTHEACSFFFLLFSSGFIMAQNSVIFNCGGKYFHVNNTFGPIFTSFCCSHPHYTLYHGIPFGH